MIKRLTDSILSARALSARIHTLVSNASQVGGAIVIGVTFQSYTTHKWITLEADGTTAASAMITAITLRVQSTRIGNETWIDTLTMNALLVAQTLIVRLTANRYAAELRIA